MDLDMVGVILFLIGFTIIGGLVGCGIFLLFAGGFWVFGLVATAIIFMLFGFALING